MGGKGSGKKAIYHDEFHKKWRDRQRVYDEEIKRIHLEHKVSWEEARRMRKIQLRAKKIQKWKEEEAKWKEEETVTEGKE